MRKFLFLLPIIVLCFTVVSVVRIHFFTDKEKVTSSQFLVNGQKPIAGTWVEVGPPLEVKTLKKSDFESLTTRDYKSYWISDNLQREIVHQNIRVFSIQFPPSKDRLSFFYYPEGHSLGDMVLLIYDPDKNSLTEVYRGSHRTSNYEWQDDSMLAVNYSCGTACMIQYQINSHSGEVMSERLLY